MHRSKPGKARASADSRNAAAKQIKAIPALFPGTKGSVTSQDYVGAMVPMHRARREIDTAKLTADIHCNGRRARDDLDKVPSHPGGEDDRISARVQPGGDGMIGGMIDGMIGVMTGPMALYQASPTSLRTGPGSPPG